MTIIYKDVLQNAQDKRKHIISGDVTSQKTFFFWKRKEDT
jgi:hypothetical protein